MRSLGRAWGMFTTRGRVFLVLGLVVLLVSMAASQRDVMRLGLLLIALPVVAVVLVARARLRLSCERSVEPARSPLGSPMHGRIVLGQQGRLPAGLVLMEDQVPPQLGTAPRFTVDKPGLAWRREVEYPLLGRERGRFRTGPLLVRTADPFGLVQLDRQFVATTEVLVTPQIVALGALRGAGGAGSTGDSRPHRIGVVGQDDVLIREYRQGDDVRRVHWPSTARRGDLMVRREEQAWDPSVSIVLDSRSRAHAGSGIYASLEWAVSAAASIALHFLDDGYGVEIYEAEGPLQVGGAAGAGGSGFGGQHHSLSREAVVTRLTDLRARQTGSLRYAIEAASLDRTGQLVIAICGRMSVEEAQELLQVRRHRSQGMALLLDVDTFARPHGLTDDASTPQTADEIREQARGDAVERLLREEGWRVVRVRSGLGVADAWQALEQSGVSV